MRLGPGINNPEVKKLQVFLKEKGFFSGELITEVFGKETKKAVITFQMQHQIIASKTQADAGIDSVGAADDSGDAPVIRPGAEFQLA